MLSLLCLKDGELYRRGITVRPAEHMLLSKLLDRPNSRIYSPNDCLLYREIPSDSQIFIKIDTDACKGTDTEVNYLEHVQAVVTANSSRRGDLEMFLTSPMGTRSMILSKRPNDDDHRDGFTKWPFMTTHTWGEYPQGVWLLEVRYVCSYF